MSFVQTVEVGFFGFPDEQGDRRYLTVDESLALLQQFCQLKPASVDAELTEPKGNRESQLVGLCDRKYIILRRGVLSMLLGDSSLTFAAFVATKLGCTIYSEAFNGDISPHKIANLPGFPAENREFLDSL